MPETRRDGSDDESRRVGRAVTKELFEGQRRLRARAWCIADRIDTRLPVAFEPLASTPLAVRAGARGLAVVFRYGAVVLFELDPQEESAFLELLRPALTGAFPKPGIEDAEITTAPEPHTDEVAPDGTLVLLRADLPRILSVAHVLAKSAVLDHYEQHIAALFERIEGQSEALRSHGRIPTRGKELLRQIGDVLSAQTRSVARVEVTEKPEMTWDEPELDRLYERLSIEYELRSRDLALTRKIDLIWDTAQTLLEVLQSRRSLRVEWYIALLIIFETLLVGYDVIR